MLCTDLDLGGVVADTATSGGGDDDNEDIGVGGEDLTTTTVVGLLFIGDDPIDVDDDAK
jgi:hypothetical protein